MNLPWGALDQRDCLERLHTFTDRALGLIMANSSKLPSQGIFVALLVGLR